VCSSQEGAQGFPACRCAGGGRHPRTDEGREAVCSHHLEVPWIPDKLRGYGDNPVWHIFISFFPRWTHILFGLLLPLLLLDTKAAYYLGRRGPSSFKKYL